MKRLTRLVSILGVAALSLSVLAGCGKTTEDAAAGADTEAVSEAASGDAAYDLSNVKLMSEGVLSVGCEVGYPPFEDFAEDGTTPIGFDVDIITEVARRLGLEVNIINTAWDGIFAGARYYAPGDYDLSPEGVRAEFGLLSGYSYSVYVIANMGDLTALPNLPVSESAMRKLSLDAGLAASPALPMAGHANLSAGNNVSILLYRLVARVNCNITLPEDAQLEEVRLCQAPVICTPFLSGFRAEGGEVADGDRFSFDPSSCGRYISGPAGEKGQTLTESDTSKSG